MIGLLKPPFRILKLLVEFALIIFRRLRTQGPRMTFLWLYAVGIPVLTGRLSLRHGKITDDLFIGPQYGRKGRDFLASSGITATVSLRAEFDDLEHGLSFESYSYLPTVDNTPPTIAHLEEGIAFIREVIDEGGKVFVHCGSGVGRAPTLAAAYLIAEKGLSVADAIDRVTKARPFIRILPDQVSRLFEYEEYIRPAKVLEEKTSIEV